MSYSLLSVAQFLGEFTLKSFISYHHSCYLCSLHIQKSSPECTFIKKKKENPLSAAPSGGQRLQPGVMTNGRQQSGDSDNLSSDGGARRKTESPNAGKNQSPIKARPCVNCGKIGK